MRYTIAIVHEDGYEYVTATTRRYNGALAEAENAAALVRTYMRSRATTGDRTVEGTALDGSHAVTLMLANGRDITQRIVIRPHCPRHGDVQTYVCASWQCGRCYEADLLATRDRARVNKPYEVEGFGLAGFTGFGPH